MIELPDCITVENSAANLTILRIHHPAASARVSLQGAQVLHWTPLGQQRSVLYLSPDATFEICRAIRGGIPLCWPWFGAPTANPDLAAHGFARIRPWQLIEASAAGSGVDLHFQLTGDHSTLLLWPWDFACRLRIHLGATLRVELTTENTGNKAFVLTEALHTYVQVGDITQVTVTGLDGARYLDTVGEQAWLEQIGDIHIEDEVDRQYESTGPVNVNDPVLRRTVVVTKSGSKNSVVWNPWIEKTARLTDLPDNAWLHFVCVEAANVGNDAALLLQPGAVHCLETTLALLDLPAGSP